MRSLIISRPDRLGDVVISTSCLAPIREKFPDTDIYFVADEKMRPLLEGHRLLAGFIPLQTKLDEAFRRTEASVIVHLHPSRECYEAAERAGIPNRIGYPLDTFNHGLTCSVPDWRKQGLVHEAAYNFELLQPLGIKALDTFSQNIHLPESSRDTLQERLPWPIDSTRYAVIHPTAHSKCARWPFKRFLQIADRIKKELDLIPVFIGGETDEPIPVGTNFLNLAGKTDLGELGWLLKRAHVFVGNASGPSHLAAAVGCPVVVVLFGRTSPIYGPTRWKPLSDRATVICSPVAQQLFERKELYWQRCFQAISVEAVFNAVRTGVV